MLVRGIFCHLNRLLLVFAWCCCWMMMPYIALAEEEYSAAEQLLWLADHLASIKEPATLYYKFTKTGTLEEGFEDSVTLVIQEARADGTKRGRVDFFTGDRRQIVPDHNRITGNPVLSVYLQGDVYEMKRLTNGHWRHFHRRLKLAFANNAKVEPLSFVYDGKSVSGHKITISPYLDDPRRRDYEILANKQYTFILSPEVPGMLYEIGSVVLDSDPNKEPLIDERVRLISVVDDKVEDQLYE